LKLAYAITETIAEAVYKYHWSRADRYVVENSIKEFSQHT